MSYSTDSPPTMVGRFELELLIGIHEESKGVSDETSILSLLEKRIAFQMCWNWMGQHGDNQQTSLTMMKV